MTSVETILPEIDQAIAQAIVEGVFPGAAIWIYWRGEVIKCSAYGFTDRDPARARPVTTGTIYDLASLTKVIATTTAVMHLVERGALSLEAKLAGFFPQASHDPLKAAINIRQLLTHTAGFPVAQLYQHCRNKTEVLAAIFEQELAYAPGSGHLYDDLGFMLLGEIIAQTAGLPLDQFARRYIYEPLEMPDTIFTPTLELLDRIAPTELTEWRGAQVHGQVHDENAWVMGGVAGHAGLFSTVGDIGRLCSVLLQQGRYNGQQWLQPHTIAQFTAPQRADFPLPFGLGWMTNMPYFMGPLAQEGSYGHTGFTGTSLILNQPHQLAVVLLSNRVCPTRTGPAINPIRQQIANALFRLVISRRD